MRELERYDGGDHDTDLHGGSRSWFLSLRARGDLHVLLTILFLPRTGFDEGRVLWL